MDQGLIPRRYAKALLEAAEETNVASELYTSMLRLSAGFAAEKDLQHVMRNPFVKIEEKEGLLLTACGLDAKTKGGKLISDFVRLLVKNGRIELMREICESYMRQYRERHDIVRVEVESAKPLTSEQEKRLRTLIGARLPQGGTVELEKRVDPELIGGFVININNERLDASVKNEIEQLRHKLIK